MVHTSGKQGTYGKDDQLGDVVNTLMWDEGFDCQAKVRQRGLTQLRWLERLTRKPLKYTAALAELFTGSDGDAPVVVEDDELDLGDVKVTIVGCARGAHQRIRMQLEDWGASVNEVAPSKESRVSADVRKAGFGSADVVLEMTSQMGHDSSVYLDVIVNKCHFDRRRVTGGPSQAAAEIRAWAASRTAA